MLLVIDNYDSFTYNLVQYIGELGLRGIECAKEIKVYRNDAITIEKIEQLKPDAIIISPGPGRPENAGISVQVIKHFSSRIPILGVCLGHQCIAYAYNAKIIYAKKLMHGKTSLIYHDNKSIYTDIENPFVATRYHSLVVNGKTLPVEFEVSARSEDGEVMGIRNESKKLEGVQFHPESILTKVGKKILSNFLRQCIK